MSCIAPTVTAYDLHEYRRQMDVVVGFASRIHIDLMDGIFAPTKSPDTSSIWLPTGIISDIHLMFQHPARVIGGLLKLKPAMIIVQAEADRESVGETRDLLLGTATRFGVSLLASSRPDDPRYIELVKSSRHVLVFSGKLGYHGGTADMSMLDKVSRIKELNPRCEIGWDGGINSDNISEISSGGVDVLNIGGSIHHQDDPGKAYMELISRLA
jgi:ribulose-phosphate 3-epimerase